MPKDTVLELIKGYGKGFEALSKEVMTGDETKLIDFTNEIAIAIRDDSNRSVNRFEFIASESLSGGRHPCSYPTCRFNKLDELKAFATFYADTVYVQDPFEKVLLRESDNLSTIDRDNILFGLLTYLYLKPLLDKGIVKFGHSLVNVCDNHKRLLADPLNDKRDHLEEIIHEEITTELLKHCIFTFGITESKVHFIELTGPEGLVPHGRQYFHLYELPKSFKQLAQKKVLPYVLTEKDIIESKVTSFISGPIVENIFFQEWHSTFYRTKHLTDDELHLNYAKRINDIETSRISSALTSSLKHSLPIAFSKDTNEILKIRESEKEAFEVYRDKINKLVKDLPSQDPSNYSEMFNDIIVPEINIINKQINDRKKTIRSSISDKVLFGLGTVTVGLYSGIIPQDIGNVIAAIGGCKCAIDTLSDWNKSFKPDEEARKNDLFFLWKANIK